MRKYSTLYRIFVFILSSFLTLSLIALTPKKAGAQDSDTPIEFTGIIQSIDGATLVVSGLTVQLTDVAVVTDNNDASTESVANLQVGATITVNGTLTNGVVVANTVIIVIGVPVMTAEPTAEVTAAPTSEPTPAATDDADDDDEEDDDDYQVVVVAPIIIIEGPVVAINVDSIQIFNFTIQVNPSDSILTEIQVGDFVRVEGEASLQNNIIIIVAINIVKVEITIVNPGIGIGVGIPGNCKVSKNGRIKCSGRGSGRGS